MERVSVTHLGTLVLSPVLEEMYASEEPLLLAMAAGDDGAGVEPGMLEQLQHEMQNSAGQQQACCDDAGWRGKKSVHQTRSLWQSAASLTKRPRIGAFCCIRFAA